MADQIRSVPAVKKAPPASGTAKPAAMSPAPAAQAKKSQAAGSSAEKKPKPAPSTQASSRAAAAPAESISAPKERAPPAAAPAKAKAEPSAAAVAPPTAVAPTKAPPAATEATLALPAVINGVLDLSSRELRAEHVEVLARKLPALGTEVTSISLSANSIGSGGADALKSLLGAAKHLESLDLYMCFVGREGAAALAAAIKSGAASKLRRLNLGWNNIGDDGAKDIASVVGMIKLDELILESNQIGVSGAQSVAEALVSNSTISALDISSNLLKDGASKFAAVLENPSSKLRSLKISGDHIFDPAIIKIFDALHSNTVLTHLDLEDNFITGKGAAACARMIESNRTLLYLNIEKNKIPKEGLVDIAQSLKSNQTITEFMIRGNALSASDRDHMAKAVQAACAARFKECQAIKDAFCCGLHERLGSDSPLLALADDSEILEGILLMSIDRPRALSALF